MKTKNYHLMLFVILIVSISAVGVVDSQSTDGGDAAVMQLLKKSLKIPTSLNWSAPDPCQWTKVQCSDGRVTRVQIGNQGVSGSVPTDLKNMTSLERLEVQGNSISGPLPSLSGMGVLQVVLVHNNNFTSIPQDFFIGLSSLQVVDLDDNPFSPWTIPESVKNASSLQSFSANSANVVGVIPDVFAGDNFPSLVELHLSRNRLEGSLPKSFSGSNLQSLWLNGQESDSKLNGTIEVLQKMTSLTEIWLNLNAFTGPIPDFSNSTSLRYLNLRDNQFTGPVPPSILTLKSLKVVNLTNNLLQGPMPEFDPSVVVDLLPETNSFCLPKPGDCDPQLTTLLSFAKNLGYPVRFAQNWKGNNPCDHWLGITCVATNSSIIVLNFQKMGLTGTISPDLSLLQSLQKIILSSNSLYGTIPKELANLKNLNELDLSNNNLSGRIPSFTSNVDVNTDGNPNIGKDIPVPSPPGTPSGGSPGSSPSTDDGPGKKKSSKGGVVVGLVVGVIGVFVLLAVLLSFCIWRKKQNRFGKVQSPTATLHPRHSGSGPETVKITVATPGQNAASCSEALSQTSGDSSDVHVVEANHMVISIQVLRNVTNNFSEHNILGRGGFGTVYKGELHDGTKIAVKRMESGVLREKGLTEFRSEIALVTRVRHRHLVNLVGYCLDGNERLLVYEYMPQGTLSRHLFHWEEEGLKPLEWTRRLTIALDVARGVEYLHNLAQQSYIHRDLKPSNILLDDGMRAKVADFGLARLAPSGKGSIQTRLAGTFGYLAPEYAATGRVTTKSDVFSFGVILMELITGRRALDENEPEECMHLVTWFKRMQVNKDTSKKAIDPTIDLTEETHANISIVAELAGHCCAREAHQRPDMGRVVNVLSSLAEQWKPIDPVSEEDVYGIDLAMTLPQALKRWQAFEGNSCAEGNSSSSPSNDNTQTSIPTRPSGFAESFRSEDGR
ncbi:hypothetical protein Syun_022744 [Stephania yunnanensis]|uniref:non-specific serine/threonine protein kinase n=1 Tax=Stephania yunnanensis TaxID=152371 RepID=A0AAP0FK05_9MAGN